MFWLASFAAPSATFSTSSSSVSGCCPPSSSGVSPMTLATLAAAMRFKLAFCARYRAMRSFSLARCCRPGERHSAERGVSAGRPSPRLSRARSTHSS